jgi:hypothetical protein
MPFGPRKIKIRFGASRLTHYGGVYLLHRFLSGIGFKEAISSQVRIPQRNNRYTVGEMVLAVLYPIILGLERLETTHLLRQNGIFQFLSGLRSYPDATALRRFLMRCAPELLPKLEKLHESYQKRMLSRPERLSRLVFDIDSTVLVLYGKQELARIGYNPKKRGRPSYHPLLCFEGQTTDFWHGLLRPGDTHSSTGALDFLDQCFARIPEGFKTVLVRADKGFYAHSIIERIGSHKAGFVIVARLTGPIKNRLEGLRYSEPSRGVETAEFRYKPHGWKKAYRFVVIRRLQSEDPSDQLTLFTLGKYHYQVLVTNLPLQPLNLWRFYNGRAGVELIIKQLKGDYTLGNIPTRHFLANEAYFHLLLLAYNLMNWFKRLCLPPDYQAMTLQSLRQRVLHMPAELVKTGNRTYLATPPASGSREDAWRFAIKAIEKLRP